MSSISKNLSKISFSSQILALFTIGIFLLAIITSLAASWIFNKKVSDLVLNQGRQITTTLSHQSILPLLSGLGESARIELETTLKEYPNLRGIGIYTKEGALLIGVGMLSTAEIPANHSFSINGKPFEPVISQPSKILWELIAPVYNTDVVNEPSGELFNQEYKHLGYTRVTIDRSGLYKTQQEVLFDNLMISLGIALIVTLI